MFNMDTFHQIIFGIVTITISIILLLDISNTSFAIGEELLKIPQAKSVFKIDTMHLPTSAGSFIILIANEAHEKWPQDKHKLLTDHNHYYVQTHLVISKRTAILFLHIYASRDTPHHII